MTPMEPTPATAVMPVAAPSHRRRKWLVALAVLALLVVVPMAYYGYQSWALRQDWLAAEAETTALDPRWRLDEIEADRPQVPDAENSGPKIDAIALASMRLFRPYNVPNYDKIF